MSCPLLNKMASVELMLKADLSSLSSSPLRLLYYLQPMFSFQKPFLAIFIFVRVNLMK